MQQPPNQGPKGHVSPVQGSNVAQHEHQQVQQQQQTHYMQQQLTQVHGYAPHYTCVQNMTMVPQPVSQNMVAHGQMPVNGQMNASYIPNADHPILSGVQSILNQQTFNSSMGQIPPHCFYPGGLNTIPNVGNVYPVATNLVLAQNMLPLQGNAALQRQQLQTSSQTNQHSIITATSTSVADPAGACADHIQKSMQASKTRAKFKGKIGRSSNFRGVSYHSKHKRYIARTWLRGGIVHLGVFKEEALAALVVDLRNIDELGADCHKHLNFSPDEREKLVEKYSSYPKCPSIVRKYACLWGKTKF
mmetsp:Transcript_10477/g.19624  ORF Transcript_10477/g.19624 Transcript_10477/m.19624 type:complete len:303 (+) Transcript_10477:83-991(+)